MLQPRIIENIPAQGFEVVRDRLGELISVEVAAQEVLKGIPEPSSVYSERLTPYSDEEGIMINVFFSGVDYSGSSQSNTDGGNKYYIDVFAPGKATPTDSGGLVSSQKLHMYLGMIRYMLQSHKYNTLGFEPGLIMGSIIEQIQILDPQASQDAASITMGRITLSVRLQENQSLWDGILVGSTSTGVKLELTDKGYKYETQ